MALGFAPNLRTARLDAITTFAGANCFLRIYAGTRPLTTGGTATTLLAELQCGNPFATTSGNVLTLNTITADSAADASGTISWFRIVKSDGTTHVMDGSAGSGAFDINFVSSTTTVGVPVAVTSFTITEANA